MFRKIKTKFDTEVKTAQYYTDWSLMTCFMLKTEKINIRKTNLEVLQILLDVLQVCLWALRLDYISKNQIIATSQRACRGVSELEFALFIPTTIFEKIFSKLRSSIMTHKNCNAANIKYFTDR